MNEKRLLLTEGEKIIADKLYRALTNAKYNVDVASSANSGKSFFDSNTYDMVLTDVRLPDTDGCDFCQYIRNRDSHIPLLMISLESSNGKLESFRAGADDYVVLSEDYRELLLRIRALTRRSVQWIPRPRKIWAADIVIDLDSKEVRRNEILIPLSAKEFLVLQLLIRNKNKIVPRKDIMEVGWGRDLNFKRDRVAPIINSLRRKIDADSHEQCIYTVTGRGYLLSEKPK